LAGSQVLQIALSRGGPIGGEVGHRRTSGAFFVGDAARLLTGNVEFIDGCYHIMRP